MQFNRDRRKQHINPDESPTDRDNAPLDRRSGIERRAGKEVTAEYSLREGGGVRVNNRGFSKKENKWSEVEGKAFFVGKSSEGYLKVSFFGPFYSSYVVFELDKDSYQYAFISGPNTSYLWLLSRTPTVEANLLTQFIMKAKKLGYETEKLIYVNHK